MRSAIGKLEQETTQQQDNNASLTKHLDAMRRLVVAHFQGVELTPEDSKTANSSDAFKLTMDNVDEFMSRLRTIVIEKPKENEQLVTKVRKIANEVDYSDLLPES